MLASRGIWGATIVAAVTVLIGAPGALALEPDPALPEVEPGEVVDVAEFSARAQQWSDARRRVREAAIERAEQLASETKVEIAELAAAAAPASIAEPSVTTAPAASTTPVESGPTESNESYAESSESEPSESSRSAQTAESAKTAASESSESSEPLESSESEPPESEAVEESPESAESPEEVVVVEPEAGADIGVPEGTTLQQWHALRECESRQNYQVLNPTGQYRGAYQFSVRTWNWVAGMHYPELVGVDPAKASRADQDKMAYKLYEINGWNPWPTCKKRLPS